VARRVIRAVLSGSFHKDRKGLQDAYDELVTCGCQVLSPHRLDFDSESTLFVRDIAEKNVSEEVLEKHHLLSISQADFLWLHVYDGHIGTSTALEIGYAVANNIPVFTNMSIEEQPISSFVCVVGSVYKAIGLVSSAR